jgi:hypothetical protein
MGVKLTHSTRLESGPQPPVERFWERHVLRRNRSETTNRSDVEIRCIWTIGNATGNKSFERRVERAVASDSRRQGASRGCRVAHRGPIVPAASEAIKRRKHAKNQCFSVEGSGFA